MKNSLSAAAWAWLVLVGLASFLTWATFNSQTVFGDAFTGFPSSPFKDIDITTNAWNSNLRLFGASLPNWLPIFAAFAAAGAFYARSNGADLSPKLPRLLLIYAFIHVALFGFILWSDGKGSLGIGPLVTLLALGGLWKTIVVAPQKNSVKPPIVEN